MGNAFPTCEIWGAYSNHSTQPHPLQERVLSYPEVVLAWPWVITVNETWDIWGWSISELIKSFVWERQREEEQLLYGLPWWRWMPAGGTKPGDGGRKKVGESHIPLGRVSILGHHCTWLYGCSRRYGVRPHHSLSKGVRPSMALLCNDDNIMHFVTYICIYTSWFSMSLNISYKYDSSQPHDVWVFHLPVVRACFELFVLGAEELSERPLSSLQILSGPVEQPPSDSCFMGLWGQPRSEASSSHTASQNVAILKTPPTCLATSDLFP